MRAVLLVGGFGTRLRPLTHHIPKPMLPVGHRPMIELVVAQLALGGVTEVVLALGFRPEPFRAAFPDDVCAGVPLTYAVEPEPLDTAGAIRFAAEQAGIDETFVVVNGDVLCDLDVSRLVQFHRASGAEGTLHLTAVDNPSAFGVVVLDDNGSVRRFVEKPPPGTEQSNLINAGTYVLEPSVIARIPAGRKVSIERETFPAMVLDHTLFGLATDDYWMDTGQPPLYLQANLDVLDGHRRHLSCRAVAESAQVGGDVRIEHSLVGEGVTVGNRVTLRDSVLLPGARVGDDAVIESSIVAGTVGNSARLSDCVIGSDGRVDAASVLVASRVPAPIA
jgi:mannose-1-phosphate guanylyltransferase